jgi:hypothetical protein
MVNSVVVDMSYDSACARPLTRARLLSLRAFPNACAFSLTPLATCLPDLIHL